MDSRDVCRLGEKISGAVGGQSNNLWSFLVEQSVAFGDSRKVPIEGEREGGIMGVRGGEHIG